MLLCSFVVSLALTSQVDVPRLSPLAEISQNFGVNRVHVSYSRPSARGRTVFGEVVPFGEIWRTGANAPTTLAFDRPVSILDGQIPAGTYSLFTIPNQNSWTVILNDDGELRRWRDRDEARDVFSVQVSPESGSFVETFTLSFENVTPRSLDLVMAWAQTRVVLPIQTATAEQAVESFRQQLSWAGPMRAAEWCLENNVNLEEAYTWIEVSTLLEENYWNLRVKAQMHAAFGKLMWAIHTMELAFEHATAMESEPFDLAEMRAILAGWKQDFVEENEQNVG